MKDEQFARFNYIITIHNKQDLIEKVLNSVLQCMTDYSAAYPVLDGCTDNTENIIDQIIKNNPKKKIVKVYQHDVHELKSINAGILASSQIGDGYNIVLQDDVVFNDFDIENKIIKLYSNRPKLGIVSFRHGGNLNISLLKKNSYFFPIKNYVESVLGHNPNFFTQLKLGYFVYREIAIKSPICLPFTVINLVGLPDEEFAPWDDIDYCFRVSMHDFNNGVYSLDITSEIEWGTTRTKAQQVSTASVEQKNIKLFKQKNIKLIKNYKTRIIYKSKAINLSGSDQSYSIPFSFRSLKSKLKLRIRNILINIFSR